jgi:hypothetical protein
VLITWWSQAPTFHCHNYSEPNKKVVIWLMQKGREGHNSNKQMMMPLKKLVKRCHNNNKFSSSSIIFNNLWRMLICVSFAKECITIVIVLYMQKIRNSQTFIPSKSHRDHIISHQSCFHKEVWQMWMNL